MKITIKMQGVADIQHELEKTVSKEKISRALEQSSMLVTGEAMRYCPVMTGRLQKSITPRRVNDLTWEIEATASYADIIEFGSYKINAGTPDNPLVYTSGSGKYPSYRPFLRSALWDCQDRIFNLFNEVLNEKQ